MKTLKSLVFLFYLCFLACIWTVTVYLSSTYMVVMLIKIKLRGLQEGDDTD